MSDTEPLTDLEQKPAGEEQPDTEQTTVTVSLSEAAEEQQESQPAAEQVEAQEPSQPAESAGSAAGEEQQSEEPAQQQEEAPAEGAGEQEAPQPEEGEVEETKEEEEEPVVVVTPEGSPHWLSSDDVLAKGVPGAEVENYKNFHFKQAHALHTWYETLKEHTFSTEFITLTTAEVDVLLAAAHPGGVDQPELSEEQQELLTELEKKIDQAIKEFGEGEGACVRINTRSPTDAVLERNDATFIAEIRDAVINEVEVEKQSANAYAIWTEKPEERPGVFRRGVDAIRSSFKRPRTTSAARRDAAAKTKLEEEKKEEEGEKKEEEGEKEEVVEKKEEEEGEKEEGEKEIEEQKEGEDEKDGEGDGEGEKAERRPGVIRRGVDAIRRSFRRSRTSSATTKEDKTEQEEKKEGEEEKEKEEGEKEEEGQKEEVAEGEGEKEEGEEKKEEEEEEEGKEKAEKKPGMLRRGVEAIRHPFRKSHPSSDATGEETAKLEEEKQEGEGEEKEEEKEKEEGEKEEEGQKEEVAEGEGEKKEGEEEKKEEEEGEKRPGLIRRGLDAIGRSFRRSRTSTGEKPQLEEEKEGEEEKDGKEAEVEQTPTEQAADGEPAQTVTVEATIEGGEQPEAETTGEVQEQKTEGEGQAEGEQKEGGAQEEGGAKAEGEDEIQELGKEEGEEPKEKSAPRSLRKKKSKPVGEAHSSHKGKSETPENQLLRAFARVTSSKYRVSNGKEAIDLVLRSIRVKQDLTQLKAFGEIEDLTVRLLVRQWQPQIPQYPGMQFRGFVYKNELHALSQLDDTTFYPNMAQYKMTIQQKVEEFFNEHVRDALKDFENYIINFFVAPDKIYIFRLLPFYTSVGACLFTWREHAKIFMNGPFEFRIVETAKAAPECFSSLQPDWANMLDSVIQQRHRHGSNCVLL